MTDAQFTKLALDVATSLATLNTNMENVLKRLENHEQRLATLESGKSTLKDDLLKLLAKGLVLALISIGSLTGAAGLIKGILL